MNNDIKIFWNHVGREHGELSYAPIIQKNAEYIKKKSLEMKLKRCKEEAKNQFCYMIKIH